MTWSDNTFKTTEPVELTDMPDGTIEMSWADTDGSRLTVLLPRAEFATLVDKGRALLAPAVAV